MWGASAQLAPLKTITPKRKMPPWIDTELQLLIENHNVTHIRNNRFGRAALLEKFIDLCDEVERRTKTAQNIYLKNHITDALDNNKNIWK